MSFDPDTVKIVVGTPEGYKPVLVIALGYPAETVVLEESDGNVKYWRDSSGVHHVPKLPLEDILYEQE